MGRKLELGLTARELQVAHLVRHGLTDRDIGTKLFISRRTAEWHLKQIFNKLGVSSRSQVAAWVALDQLLGTSAHSTDEQRHNLPLQLTTFVGRERELAEIRQLLATKRLVTLTAVGGAGKTRLALELASRVEASYQDGSWVVDLTPIKDGGLVARTFGSALGVHERPRQPIAETLLEYLRSRHALLIVDNCEHLTESCAGLVDTILRSCPRMTLLATSREPLRVSGETVWRVAPLAVPGHNAPTDLDDLAQFEAVTLFLDRAKLAAPDFEMNHHNASAIAQVCRRLDGIPLAIELAAARTGALSPDQILNRMQDRFGLLTAGTRAGPARHRTLQAAVDWSYDLLSDVEQSLFRRLSIFTGGFSLEAVEYICASDDVKVGAITGLVSNLVDKSLATVAIEESASMRFLLLETLQQYGHERLAEAGEEERLIRRYTAFFVSLAEEAAPKLTGPDQRAWHSRLVQELGNLRSALEWSSSRDPEANLRLSGALTDFWHIHGLVQEGDGWLTRALAGYGSRDELRMSALGRAANTSYWRDDSARFSAICNERLDIARELDDMREIGRALNGVGQAAEWQMDFKEARVCYDRALAISGQLEDARTVADILRYKGRLAMKDGDHAHARTLLEESISHFERIGDQRPINFARGYLGLNAVESGDFAAAHLHLEMALSIARNLDFALGVATPLMYFAALAAAEGRPTRALRLSAASEVVAESAGAVPVRLTRPLVERWMDKSRRQLGPKRSAACTVEGRAMNQERAIEYALHD